MASGEKQKNPSDEDVIGAEKDGANARVQKNLKVCGKDRVLELR